MHSGSLKDLAKTINDTSSSLSLPLPQDLLDVIAAYVEKHETLDDSDSQRLQEELFNIYHSSIIETPSRLAPFLAILRVLKPFIHGSGRLLQWWDELSVPVLNHLGVEKGLAFEAKNILLGILVYDDEDEKGQVEDAKATSDAVTESLMSTWLAKRKAAAEEFDDHAKFVEGQIAFILMAFGRKRPEAFLSAIDKFFVKKDSRILALSLLCEFIRHQPPHLHQLLDTPLFDNLLRCLQIDTSTRAISLAMTCLVMFLPHIPITASEHLPALFNIYTRMLFWDRERNTDRQPHVEDGMQNEKTQQLTEERTPWVKLSYLLDSDDDTVPELLHYFTFLYGLYPINFMSYIRKPQRYLRHAKFPGADDLDIEPTEIRERSEPFRQVHLLHPNFFHLTIDTELSDNNRWRKSEAADVVAECMAFYTPGEDGQGLPTRSRVATRTLEPNSDIPEQPLLEQEAVTPFQSRHTSWRNTQSTAVASPDGCRTSDLHRKASQTSQSMPSIADSPSIQPVDRLDSPTLPSSILASPSNNQLSDMLYSTKSTRGSIYQSLTNDSAASLALSNMNHDTSHVDAYLTSLTRDPISRSPSLRPLNADPSLRIAYLHREIQLLRNDLNFERYLKQQHLSHIGQLRRKQIREARIEAETQNLVNSNRGLKSKLEEAKRANIQMKKENEKSKTHSRKWESDLSTKLRALREEQKKWTGEREELHRDLKLARESAEKLKQLVITSEARELGSLQKVMSVEASLDELERLRTEVEDLNKRMRAYEAGEMEALKAKEDEEIALNRVTILEMELQARDKELSTAKWAFENEVQELRSSLSRQTGSPKKNAIITHDLLDSALSASRNRIIELQKAHNHLLKRYTALQNAYVDLKEHLDENHKGDEPLLSGYQSRPPSPTGNTYRRRHANSDTDLYDNISSLSFPVRPARLDTQLQRKTSNPGSPNASGQGQAQGQPHHFQSPQPFKPMGGGGSKASGSVDADSIQGEGYSGAGSGVGSKVKIKPQSEVRIYGRGGVQNIGKKEKEKKEKEKDKDKDKDKGKKPPVIRGLRGFA